MQIDSAVVLMLLGVESHGIPPLIRVIGCATHIKGVFLFDFKICF